MKKQVFREMYYGNEVIAEDNNTKEVKIKAVKPKKIKETKKRGK